MIKLLGHRGPDESKTLLAQPFVGLGHCRLKVIDLTPEAGQPMASEDSPVWLCYNGEVYNFKELRAELETQGFTFRSRCDTEVILRAYQAWGVSAIRRLDGMFALALWDGLRQELLLARDRTGKKPLFYWTNGDCFAFASEIKALFAHPHVPKQLEEQNLPYLLAFGYPPPGQTCFKEIRQLEPGNLLVFRLGGGVIREERYWALPPERESALPLPEAKQQLRDLLTEAVRKRLVADVPLGAFLSGGIDSTIVVGLMARLGASKPKTFSIGFEGDPSFNETAYAACAAERFRTDHTVFTVKPDSFDLLTDLVRHHDQPFGDSSAIPTFLLSKLTRSHVTVALNGDGGDELFAGYQRFGALLASDRLPPMARRAAGGLSRLLPVPSRSRNPLSRAKRFLETAGGSRAQRYYAWTTYLPQPDRFLLKDLPGSDLLLDYRNFLEDPWGGSLLDRVLRLNFSRYLPCDLHVKMDRCSMAHGLETRSPFLDTALVEWAFRLPGCFKWRGFTSKWILKETFDDLLPPLIRRRSKMGFGVPLGAWFRKSLRQPLADHLCAANARMRRYLDPGPIRRMVEDHWSGRQDFSNPLWLLLTFEVWLTLFEL